MRKPALFSIFFFSATLAAQHGSNPAVRLDQTTVGAKIFRAQCAACHGIDGSGTGAGPNINSGNFRRGSSDDALVTTISKGVPGTSMPAFSLEGGQMWQLVAYIRSLSIVRAATNTVGDVKSGEALFQANCAGCHTEAGAFTGPNLSRAAARLTAAQLRQSIEEPHAVVAPEYWSVVARTTAGQSITGTRLNEDTSSIQMRDRSGRLFSVLKKDLATFDIDRKSPMPTFKGKLSDAEIGDIVAYLVKGDQ
jgi:putative heme-binding domain-containing protein